MEEKECLRGFQPNPTTGDCEPIFTDYDKIFFPTPTIADAKTKNNKKCEPKCKKGTRCNPATGICDPRDAKKIRCEKKCPPGTKCNTRKGVCETRKKRDNEKTTIDDSNFYFLFLWPLSNKKTRITEKVRFRYFKIIYEISGI